MTATRTTPADAIALPSIAIDDICPSPTNPRTHFDPAYIEELAKSFEPDGILQPLTLRPLSVDGLLHFNKVWRKSKDQLPPKYEIIMGECRWRAAKVAKMATVPAFYRDVDDRTAIRMQVVENLKRKDLDALEEAAGYDRMVKEFKFTVPQIAAEIGKSESYVHASRKLLALNDAGRKAFYAGELDKETALLIARVPHSLQGEALRRVIDSQMSTRQARDYIKRNYMLELSRAPFSRADASLVPSAGACTTCSKCTGNARDLFSDVKEKDVCTDPPCYEAKEVAHAEVQRTLAKQRGQQVIAGREAAKIAPGGIDYRPLKEDYLKLDEYLGNGKKVSDLLGKGKDAPQPALLVDPTDKTRHIEVISRATLAEHLKAKGIALPSNSRGKSDKEKAEEQKRKQDLTFRQRLFDQVRSALLIQIEEQDMAPYLEPEEEIMVALAMYKRLEWDHQKRVALLWYGPEENAPKDDHALCRAFEKRIETLDRKATARLMIDMATISERHVPTYGDHKPERLLQLAKNMSIDTAAIKTEIIAEARAKEKPKGKGKVKPAAAKVQPNTADSAPGPLKIGDAVRIKDNVRSPTGAPQIGKTGKITASIGTSFMVRIDKSGTSTSFTVDELEKLPPAVKKTATDPIPAAQASGNSGGGAKNPAPAAPASDKPSAAKPKKAKAKTDPAPATQANEPAKTSEASAVPNGAPVVKPATAASTWPFPIGNRPEGEKAVAS